MAKRGMGEDQGPGFGTEVMSLSNLACATTPEEAGASSDIPSIIHSDETPQITGSVSMSTGPGLSTEFPNASLPVDLSLDRPTQVFDKDFRNALLRCYVRWAHPFLPVLNLETFLGTVAKHTPSMLLLQVVMLAGLLFADLQLIATRGFVSRQQAQMEFLQRVKLLYESDAGKNPLVEMQAALIMSTTGGQDSAQGWLQAAIKRARQCGLHCRADYVHLSKKECQLRRRVWWTCYAKDRLQTATLGTPSLIDETDFDIYPLTVEDMEVDAISLHLQRTFDIETDMIADSVVLARSYVELVRCCRNITGIRPFTTGGEQESILAPFEKRSTVKNQLARTRSSRTLENWFQSLPPQLNALAPGNHQHCSRTLRIYQVILSGIYLAFRRDFRRSHLTSPVSRKHYTIPMLFSAFLHDEDIPFLPSIAVTVLTPAIRDHLGDLRSLGQADLGSCITVLCQLRGMYVTADILYRDITSNPDKRFLRPVQGGQYTGEEAGNAAWHMSQPRANIAIQRITSPVATQQIWESSPAVAAEYILDTYNTTEWEREMLIHLMPGSQHSEMSDNLPAYNPEEAGFQAILPSSSGSVAWKSPLQKMQQCEETTRDQEQAGHHSTFPGINPITLQSEGEKPLEEWLPGLGNLLCDSEAQLGGFLAELEAKRQDYGSRCDPIVAQGQSAIINHVHAERQWVLANRRRYMVDDLGRAAGK
ncbi:hypothetical protein BDV12DRAFT_203475 [Aspergillus spectabilis]